MSRALFAICLLAALALSTAGPVADGWANHFEAFSSMNATQIMADYTEDSVVLYYDQETGGDATSYAGLEAIEGMFNYFFDELNYNGSNPTQTWEEPQVDELGDFGMVFLLWNGCHADDADCVYRYMTDTFVFNTEGKIIRQTVVKFPGDGGATACPGAVNGVPQTANAASPQQMAWENHFAAFGGQNVTKIMLDYDDTSKMRLYNYLAAEDTRAIAEQDTTAGISATFTGLFDGIQNASDVSAPVVITQTFSATGAADNTDAPTFGITYLVWRSPTYNFPWVTDTFVYDSAGVIVRQNIALLDTCVEESGGDDDDDDDDDDDGASTASMASLSTGALLVAAALQM